MESPTEPQTQDRVEVPIASPTIDESNPLPHDSMVTVRLSEPPTLTIDTTTSAKPITRISIIGEVITQTPDILLDEEEEKGENAEEDGSPKITGMDPNGNDILSPSGSDSAGSQNGESRRGSDSSEDSVEGGGVNWEELEKTEENEPRDESSDDVSLDLPCKHTVSNDPVHGITSSTPRTGKQFVGLEPEIWDSEGANNRECTAKRPVETAVDTASQETG